MEVVNELRVPLWPRERSVVTIGAYDGVHLGHQAVIAQVRRRAATLGARAVVVTFDTHPAAVVRPESAPLLLTSTEQRLELLAATGLDATVVVHFDHSQAEESPEQFAQRVLVDALAAKTVVVGSDFHFGKGREGNVDLLEKIGRAADFVVEPIELLPRPDGVSEPVSSTAIRRALAGGDIELAARMLGRLHEVRGVVAQGDQRGRTIGFPTANVAVARSICLPADGVYAGWFRRPDGSRWPCAINIGRRPTFYDHAEHAVLEAHLLDFEGDLYGEQVAVEFAHFLRSERKFDGIEALVNQLRLDVDSARTKLTA